MRLHLFAYQLELPGTLASLSAGAPEVEWIARTAGPKWIVEGSGPPSAIETAARSAKSAGAAMLEVESDDGSLACVVDQSPAERDFLAGLDEWEALLVDPVVERAGRASVRLLAPRPGPPAAWRARFSTARLLAKRLASSEDFEPTPAAFGDETASLSERQRTVLGLALDHGYYAIPRTTNVAAIAERVGLARSTTEEHLRVAESAVVRTFGPLFAFGTGLAGERRSTVQEFARFSSELNLYVRMVLQDDRITQVGLSRSAPRDGTPARHPYLDRILDHVRTGQDDLADLPVKLGVGPFTREVLEEVRRIPRGATASYAEIAERIGHPRAQRAVGSAVGRNPISIVVPCHRVVPACGGIGSYGGDGGPKAKERLLRAEGAAVASPSRKREPSAR